MRRLSIKVGGALSKDIGREEHKHSQTLTDEQEDEDGDGDHEGGVSVQCNGFHDPGFEDLVPPERVT